MRNARAIITGRGEPLRGGRLRKMKSRKQGLSVVITPFVRRSLR